MELLAFLKNFSFLKDYKLGQNRSETFIPTMSHEGEGVPQLTILPKFA